MKKWILDFLVKALLLKVAEWQSHHDTSIHSHHVFIKLPLTHTVENLSSVNSRLGSHFNKTGWIYH